MNVSFQELFDECSKRFGHKPPPLAVAAPTPTPPTAEMAAQAPTPAVAPAPPPTPPPAVQAVDYATKGYHLDVRVQADEVVQAATLLDEQGFSLDAVTGVDWIAENQMEVVYDYFHPENIWRVAVRCRVPRDHPEVPTISGVFAGANWHERETHEFFGIRFAGHPNLLPLLLPEDATFHPLRKDFVA
jgi:NADH-quinone oxidoreductase subunit C